MWVTSSPKPFVEKTAFPHQVVLAPRRRSFRLYTRGLLLGSLFCPWACVSVCMLPPCYLGAIGSFKKLWCLPNYLAICALTCVHFPPNFEQSRCPLDLVTIGGHSKGDCAVVEHLPAFPSLGADTPPPGSPRECSTQHPMSRPS